MPWKYFVVSVVFFGLGMLCYYSFMPTCRSNHKEGHANLTHRTQLKEQEICIYHTPKELLYKVAEDPFGNYCIDDSKYVSDCNAKGISTQNCKECGTGSNQILPKFCFCDDKTHCNTSFDDKKKANCLECASYFRKSPYKYRGNCTCSQDNVACTCNEGFTDSFMCSSIEKRICKQVVKINETLENCSQSIHDTCVVKRSDNSTMICEIFSDENVELRQDAGSCERYS